MSPLEGLSTVVVQLRHGVTPPVTMTNRDQHATRACWLDHQPEHYLVFVNKNFRQEPLPTTTSSLLPHVAHILKAGQC